MLHNFPVGKTRIRNC